MVTDFTVELSLLHVILTLVLHYLKISRIRRAHCAYTETTGELMNR
jgi:hypothetical protein